MAAKTDAELSEFLKQEAAQHLANFVEAGRKDKLPFDVLYKNLKAQRGDRGLSNSEIALAAALWSAARLGAQIDHISLAEYFPEASEPRGLDELKQKLIASDGILLSSPVYFGDRGSLAQTFTNFLRRSPDLLAALRGKVYAGIAVGAKRNGGQETTLIYQLWDMIHCGFLGVGNDSETTAQYGGTGHAGDVGTMQNDKYGLDTSMGAGRRISRVAAMLKLAEGKTLAKGPKVLFVILQERDGIAQSYVKRLLAASGFAGTPIIMDISAKDVRRCLACDVCPTDIDRDDVYRCIIKSKKDSLMDLHSDLIDADAVFPVAFSAHSMDGVQSSYQRFIERTRYLRRGDYVWSDLLSAPIVIQDLNSPENLPVRMLTSMLRHHTVLSQPVTVFRQNGQDLNFPEAAETFRHTLSEVERLTIARLEGYSSNVAQLKYNPVGYILSAAKDAEDQKMQRRVQVIADRTERIARDRQERVFNESGTKRVKKTAHGK
jgi:multimeric flavodoxin WrbA